MSRPIPIDPAAPMRSLREAAGLSQSAMAEVRGVRQPSVAESERLGSRVLLATLLDAARAFGFEVEIRVRRMDRPLPTD